MAIDTDGLKTINTFGLNVFLPRKSWLNNTQADIEVTGRFSEVFREARKMKADLDYSTS